MATLYHISLKKASLKGLKHTILTIGDNMYKEIENIKKLFGKNQDNLYKETKVNNKTFFLIWNEGLVSSDFVNDFVLKGLANVPDNADLYDYFLYRIPSLRVLKVNSNEELINLVYNAFTIVYLGPNQIIAIETRMRLDRGIQASDMEVNIGGPKDSFTETIILNIGLIRRRIKSKHLINESMTIGKCSKTRVDIMYMDNIIKEELLIDVKKKLNKLDIDGIIDSSYLKQVLESKQSNFFPTVMSTEKPDKASQALLEGKIIIIVDTSCYAIILPTFFVDYIHTPDDYYQKPINVSFIRIIRLLAFFISLLIPGIYIAITTHNHDAIPLDMLLNFIVQRSTVPFPSLIEALLMTLSFEILRESDTRMPSSMGTAVSILGGLVLGDAAVSAGIISPIMIIVIAISAISGLVFSTHELSSALRWWRIIFMFLATFLGLYGIFIGLIFFISSLTTLLSFNKPYLAPIAPLITEIQDDTIIKKTKRKVLTRNPLLTNNKKRGNIDD